jgi:hypothetical protein
MFDLVILNALYVDATDAAAIVGEAARVARPMGPVVAIVPTWLGTASEEDTRQIARLGLSPYQLVEWKQVFRDAGLVELTVDDAALDGDWLVSGLTGVVARAWRASRWRGLQAVLSRPAAALRKLSRHRVLGLALVKGIRWPHR